MRRFYGSAQVITALMCATMFLSFRRTLADDVFLTNAKQVATPEALEWLKEAARVSRSNRERIRTWKGQLHLSELSRLSNAKANGNALKTRRDGDFDVDFAVEQSTKSLHCRMRQTKPYVLIDLKTHTETVQPKIEFLGLEVIATPTVFIQSHGLPSNGEKVPHHIIKESSSAARGHGLRSILIDPLQMFVHGGWTFDDLYDQFAKNAERDPDSLKVLTGLVDGIERREIVAKFHAGDDVLTVNILVAPELACGLLMATEESRTYRHMASWSWQQLDDIFAPLAYTIETRDDMTGDITFRRKFQFSKSVLNERLRENEFALSSIEVQEGDLYQDTMKHTQGTYTNGTFVEAPVKAP